MRSSSGCRFASAILAAAVPLATRDAAPAQGGEAREAWARDARPADAAALFASFARMPGLEVRFTEEKHLALLALPLASTGSLYYLPPGYLARVVETPEASSLTLTPAELRMTDRDGTSVVDLRQNEALRVFVTSLVQVFAGDAPALERAYHVAYEPDPSDAARWTLTLTPRRKALGEMLRSLTLRGAGTGVRAIELVEPGGDRTVTTVVKADPRRSFDAEERARLFGIRGDDR
jgi:hypothetical protein